MICPKCGNETNVETSFCPRCSNEISIIKIDKDMIEELNEEEEKDIVLNQWDNKLTVTQNIITEINNIKNATDDIIPKKNQIENEYKTDYNELNTSYSRKIKELDNVYTLKKKQIEDHYNNKNKDLENSINKSKYEIDSEYTSSEKKIYTEYKLYKEEIERNYKDKLLQLRKSCDKQIEEERRKNNEKHIAISNDMNKLDQLQNISFFVKSGYNEENDYNSEKPDFSLLNSLFEKINKVLSPGLGIFLILIPIVGWFILFILKSKIIKDRDLLLNGVELGKVFLNSKSSNIQDDLQKRIDSIEKIYKNEKIKIDNKFKDFNNENEKEYKSKLLELKNDYEEKTKYKDNNLPDLYKKNNKERDLKISELKIKIKEQKNEADKKFKEYNSSIERTKEIKIKKLEKNKEKMFSNERMDAIKKYITDKYDMLGITDKEWREKFKEVKSYPYEINIGIIKYPANVQQFIMDKLIDKIPSYVSDNNEILIPITLPMNKPVQLLINYKESLKQEVMAGINTFLIKLLKFMPIFSFSITYIDPKDGGSNLGKLHAISGVRDFDVCRKAYPSKDDIQKRLKELEEFVYKTAATLAGTDSVYSYNEKESIKIEYNLIIINDFPKNFDRSALESLEVILNNSQKCGISIIFTTSEGTASYPEGVIQKYQTINCIDNNKELNFEGKKYLFKFDSLPANYEEYLKNYVLYCNSNEDNLFATYFKYNKENEPIFDDSTKKMLIPFAVNRKKIVDLELGSPLTAHALLSGTTGSGKSTTLHMLITSIIMKYHPNDVQLWLVDYKKVEFAEYIKNTPPHIKLIGLEQSKEFTCSLLDMINIEFMRRAELFKQAGVANISEYRNNGGKIPRIILIIDEFHQMTQAIQNEPHYSVILENILSEYRVFGLSCIFSDQAIGTGLRGLTDKGKMQMRTRLAMNNDFSEIRETLALDSSFYNDELKNKMLNMGVGEVAFKRMIEDEAGESKPVLDKYKTVFVTREERTDVNEWLRNRTEKPKEKPLIVDGQHRSNYYQEIIDDYEKLSPLIVDKQISIYVGTPASLNPCFYFALRKKPEGNIMLIGANDELRAAIVYWSIYSFKRQSDSKVYIFANDEDELFMQYKEKYLSLQDNNCIVSTNIGETCNIIDEISNKLQPGDSKYLIVWLGLDIITERLTELPEKSKEKTLKQVSVVNEKSSVLSAVDNMLADIENWAKEIQGSVSFDEAKVTESQINTKKTDIDVIQENNEYNAIPDIQQIMEKGSRYGIFSLVTLASFNLLKYTKFVKTENFEHKIALRMSSDESSNYLTRSTYASGLDDISAVYYDGINVKTFRPYLI